MRPEKRTMRRRPPTLILETDRRLRELERRAAQGDQDAKRAMLRARRRAGLVRDMQQVVRVIRGLHRLVMRQVYSHDDPGIDREFWRNYDELMTSAYMEILHPERAFWLDPDEEADIGQAADYIVHRLRLPEKQWGDEFRRLVPKAYQRKMLALADELEAANSAYYDAQNVRAQQRGRREKERVEKERVAQELSRADPQEMLNVRGTRREKRARGRARKRSRMKRSGRRR